MELFREMYNESGFSQFCHLEIDNPNGNNYFVECGSSCSVSFVG